MVKLKDESIRLICRREGGALKDTNEGQTRNSERSNASKAAACLRRAETLESKGEYDRAIDLLEKAISLVPDSACHHIRLSCVYRAKHQILDAIQEMERAVELDPLNPCPQELLLQLYVETGRYDDAIDGSKLLLKLQPRNMFALDVLGLSYLQKGLIDEALKVAHRLVVLDPRDSVHHFKKAVLYQNKGASARAIEGFSRVLEMDPEGSISEDARAALEMIDSNQLGMIAALATTDSVFLEKLKRNPESAIQERGFVLSRTGIATLKQVDFGLMKPDPQEMHTHYH